MARLAIFAVVIALCLMVTLASPVPDIEAQQEDGLIRQKRVTCDVLSAEAAGFALNHAACALHCLALRKKGGSCSGGVCHCRN